jgi:hypothetical protein
VDVAEDLARKLNLSRFDRSNVRLSTPAVPPKAVAREAWADLAERRLCLEHSDRVLGKKFELVDYVPARSTPSYARVGTHRRSAVGVLHRSLREVQDVVNRSMRLVFRHEKVQELGACKRRHDRRRLKPTAGHTMIPAQMWRSPGADAAQSRCRCGAVPADVAQSRWSAGSATANRRKTAVASKTCRVSTWQSPRHVRRTCSKQTGRCNSCCLLYYT